MSSEFKIHQHLTSSFSKLFKWLPANVEASLEQGLREVKRHVPGHTVGKGLFCG